ncbi:hypothetical protein SUDANB54_03599 [Streptomyces sp. enrichment culture]
MVTEHSPWFGYAADIHHAALAGKEFAESVHDFLALPEQPSARLTVRGVQEVKRGAGAV